MTDLLVKLYELPPLAQLDPALTVRRALAPEKRFLAEWVAREFSAGWASELEVAFSRQPLACFVAHQSSQVLGFACYDSTAKGFFGPTGVAASARGQGIGKSLLLAALYAMRAEGYFYAIIGGAGPVEFYISTVGAIPIPGSDPGVYRGLLPVSSRSQG